MPNPVHSTLNKGSAAAWLQFLVVACMTGRIKSYGIYKNSGEVAVPLLPGREQWSPKPLSPQKYPSRNAPQAMRKKSMTNKTCGQSRKIHTSPHHQPDKAFPAQQARLLGRIPLDWIEKVPLTPLSLPDAEPISPGHHKQHLLCLFPSPLPV